MTSICEPPPGCACRDAGCVVFGCRGPGPWVPERNRSGGGGPWGQRAARLCGAEERRACAQREARSSSCSSRLSERRERSERSEFRDAGARPSTARQSARSAPDRHSEAPRAVPMGLRRPAGTTPQVPTQTPGHSIWSAANVRNGPKAAANCVGVHSAADDKPVLGHLMTHQTCRPGCAACCIAPSISSPIPGMPTGKPAGVRCVQLDDALGCRLFGHPSRPAVCRQLQPARDMCGDSAPAALAWLTHLEVATRPTTM